MVQNFWTELGFTLVSHLVLTPSSLPHAQALVDRYAFGAGVDRPITWHTGSTLSNRNWLHADELGSVIATSDSGGVGTIYSYSPYGEPNAWNSTSATFPRFRYTGQITVDADLRTATPVQLYHYKRALMIQ